MLERHGFASLSEVRILDVGCGSGGESRMARDGADPTRMRGIDLLAERIAEARRLSPNIEFVSGTAEALPYEDASFDLVMQMTVFTSILDMVR